MNSQFERFEYGVSQIAAESPNAQFRIFDTSIEKEEDSNQGKGAPSFYDLQEKLADRNAGHRLIEDTFSGSDIVPTADDNDEALNKKHKALHNERNGLHSRYVALIWPESSDTPQ